MLDKDSNKVLFESLQDHFVKSKNLRWWWEGFRDPSNKIEEDEYQRLFEVLKDRKIWLMVEDEEGEFYPIYDTKN